MDLVGFKNLCSRQQSTYYPKVCDDCRECAECFVSSTICLQPLLGSVSDLAGSWYTQYTHLSSHLIVRMGLERGVRSLTSAVIARLIFLGCFQAAH